MKLTLFKTTSPRNTVNKTLTGGTGGGTNLLTGTSNWYQATNSTTSNGYIDCTNYKRGDWLAYGATINNTSSEPVKLKYVLADVNKLPLTQQGDPIVPLQGYSSNMVKPGEEADISVAFQMDSNTWYVLVSIVNADGSVLSTTVQVKNERAYQNQNAGGKDILITLKRDEPKENPRIKISNYLLVDDYNYAYIDIFKRYYFINSITKLNYNLSELELETDLLETYKDDILNAQATTLNYYSNEGVTSAKKRKDIYYSDVTLENTRTTLMSVITGGLNND